MKTGYKVRFITGTDGNIPYGTKGTVLKIELGVCDRIATVKFPKIGTCVVGLNEIEVVAKTKKKTKGKKK